MILLFKQEFSRFSRNTPVYDEKEEVLFEFRFHTGFKHKTDLVDANDTLIATIAKDAAIGHKHTINMNNESYHLTKGGKLLTDHFLLEPLNWKVTCSHLGETFSITDENHNVIAENHDGNTIFGFGKVALNITSDENATLVAAVYYAAMDIITSEDLYFLG